MNGLKIAAAYAWLFTNGHTCAIYKRESPASKMSKQSVADSHFWLCRRRLRPVISKGTRQRLSLFNSSLSFTTTVFTTQYFKPVSLPCVHYPEYYCVHCLKLKYKPLTVTWNCCRKCPLLSRLGLAFETVLTSHQVTSHIHDNDE